MWDLTPGQRIRRVELHARYGGSGQGGISPSATTPNVLCFTDPRIGIQYGYEDKPAPDGTFHYAGEGQTGDQTMTRGNRAIFQHASDGRALRLFEGAKGTVTYVGEFFMENLEYVRRQASDEERMVFVFHLRRISEPLPAPQAPSLGTAYREANEDHEFGPPKQPPPPDPDAFGAGNRSHRKLQNGLARLVRANGLEPLSSVLSGPDYDLAWLPGPGRLVVVEVKSTTDRNEIRQLRLGLGQVLDYRSALERPDRDVTPVLYVERRPMDIRWERLTRAVGVVLCWPDAEDRLGLTAREG
ncbi:hypothetical protein [Allorhizocola rhizosphaerae]|uniref:hypothetical protein n=1 Tax=Allorhizocola rhizosphaerae TaxID=1872709 RepID=UPI000E3E9888|nr:hypothetical protein [Allorhizocola rhizosphaerae]